MRIFIDSHELSCLPSVICCARRASAFDTSVLRAVLAEERAVTMDAFDAKLQPMQAQLLRLEHPTGLVSPSASVQGQIAWEGCTNQSSGASQAEVRRALDNLAECGQWGATICAAKDVKSHSLLSTRVVLTAKSQERELTALLTPAFAAVVQPLASEGYLLANSEDLGWIETLVPRKPTFQRPDLFVCHRAAFESDRPTAATSDSEAAQRLQNARALIPSHQLLFGRCKWTLRDALSCIIEVKLDLSTDGPLFEALGEILAKVQYLLRGAVDRPSQKCILCDHQRLFLLVFSSTGLLSTRSLEWTEEGSFVVLLDFMRPSMEPRWLRTLRGACDHFKVRLPDATDANTFLGQGATGRVFRVVCAAQSAASAASSSAITGTSAAIKVVDNSGHGEHIVSLQREVDVLQKLHEMSAAIPVLRRLLPEAPFGGKLYVRPSEDGAAAMFTPVGTTVAHELAALLLDRGARSQTLQHRSRVADQVQALWLEVLLALVTLHLCGCSHGDPRLPNLIRLVAPESRGVASSTRGVEAGKHVLKAVPQDRLMWIDFREADLFPLAHDALFCMRSFFHPPSNFGPQLQVLASEYERLLRSLVQPSAPFDAVPELPAPIAEWAHQVWLALGLSLCGIPSAR